MAVINPAHQMLKLDKFQTLVSDVYRGGAYKEKWRECFSEAIQPSSFLSISNQITGQLLKLLWILLSISNIFFLILKKILMDG